VATGDADAAVDEGQLTFEASVTAVDGRVGILHRSRRGTVWLDGVQISEHPADVFTRAFTNGLAVLNGTHDRQTVSVGSDLARLSGAQAPRTFLIVDDSSAIQHHRPLAKL